MCVCVCVCVYIYIHSVMKCFSFIIELYKNLAFSLCSNHRTILGNKLLAYLWHSRSSTRIQCP